MLGGVTREEVEAIAALANLELEASEIDLFARQLTEILAYADEVRQVETAGVPPTFNVVTRTAHQAYQGTGHEGTDRPDEVRPSLDLGSVLANAPDPAPDAGFFKVPRVIG